MKKLFEDSIVELFTSKFWKREKQKPIPNYFVGEKVSHDRFGIGVIKEIHEDKCIVLFDSGLEKELLMRFANFSSVCFMCKEVKPRDGHTCCEECGGLPF